MKKLIYILIFFIIGCLNEIKKNEYPFLKNETKIIIDSKLSLPDTFSYQGKVSNNISVEQVANYFLSPCFIDNETLNLYCEKEIDYFRISVDKNGNYKIINKNIGSELNEYYHNEITKINLIGNRLILNKKKFEVGDTIKGKFIYKMQYITYFEEDTILKTDSIQFKYIINKKDNTLSKFFISNGHYSIWNNKLYSKYFSKQRTLKFDANLKIDDTLKIRNERTGSVTTYKINQTEIPTICFMKGDLIYIDVHYLGFSDLKLILKNDSIISINYDSDIGSCVSSLRDVCNLEVSNYNITFNKKNYKVGDTVFSKLYYAVKADYKYDSSLHYRIDSALFYGKIYPYFGQHIWKDGQVIFNY